MLFKTDLLSRACLCCTLFKRASAGMGFTCPFVKNVTSKRLGKKRYWVNFGDINSQFFRFNGESSNLLKMRYLLIAILFLSVKTQAQWKSYTFNPRHDTLNR